MPRVAYVNGRYVPHSGAMVHVEDRGYLFADGVYEVCLIKDGEVLDLDLHLDRLWRSLGELRIDAPMSRRALTIVMDEIVRRNYVDFGLLYMQITRGVAHRDHAFPVGVRPSLVMLAWSTDPQRGPKLAEKGVKVISVPDIRWQRRDIKSVSLLPNILAKQQAKEAGAYEAWMIDENGYVTEGTSTNAWIVTRDGTIVTRDLSHSILSGVTRLTALDIAKKAKLKVVERPFTLSEALKAKEAFQSSTTVLIVPVVEIDGKKIGDGRPGPITLKLRAGYGEKYGA